VRLARRRRLVGDEAAIVDQLRAAGCVHAEDEARLLMMTAGSNGELNAMLEQRMAGLPLEHVLGFAEFCGLNVAAARGVFIPRRRTEFLVREAARLVSPGDDVIDVCCGSGAIGIALATLVRQLDVYACDSDPAAVQCARRNLSGVSAEVFEGDLYDPLPARLRRSTQLIVASPPYVPTAAIGLLPAEARLHEPLHALDGGADGMDMQRRIVSGASAWLAPGGSLLVECSAQQASPLAEEFAQHELAAAVMTSDELDATVVIGTAPRRAHGS
jgi:release factor glutamine methyltransferase